MSAPCRYPGRGDRDFIVVTTPGVRGVQGDQGLAGSELLVMTAGEPIGGEKVVYESADGSARLADCMNPLCANAVCGISSESAVQGAQIRIRPLGPMQVPGGSFMQGLPVFLGLLGALTQSPPTAPAFLLPVAGAAAADRIFVRIGRPIIR